MLYMIAAKHIYSNICTDRRWKSSLPVHVKDDYLRYSSWQWLENPKMPLCNCRVCTWLQNRSLFLSYTEGSKNHWRPPTNRHSAVSSWLQGRLIYTAKYNDFLMNGSLKGACVCFPRPLDHCHSVQPQRVVRHVFDMTAVQSSEDYLVLFAREGNVEGISVK